MSVNVVVAVFPAAVLVLALLSRALRRNALSPVLLALPIVLLAGLLATRPDGAAWARWPQEAGQEVGVALVLGPAIGWTVGKLAGHAHRHVFIAESFLPLVGIAASLFGLGGWPGWWVGVVCWRRSSPVWRCRCPFRTSRGGRSGTRSPRPPACGPTTATHGNGSRPVPDEGCRERPVSWSTGRSGPRIRPSRTT